jgi:hypothetical protein
MEFGLPLTFRLNGEDISSMMKSFPPITERYGLISRLGTHLDIICQLSYAPKLDGYKTKTLEL